MRNILWAGAVAFMMVGVASAQSSGTQSSATHDTTKMGAPKHKGTTKKTHLHYTMSSKTSHKGKSNLPGHLKKHSGPVGGTAGSGMPGSGPNASGANGSNK
jgi:hypothetical protein